MSHCIELETNPLIFSRCSNFVYFFFRDYIETRKISTVSEMNSKEPILLHWSSSRHYYGCRLSDVSASSNKLSFVCSKFTVICDLRSNYGYVSMASISNISDQLRAALCLELMLNMRA